MIALKLLHLSSFYKVRYCVSYVSPYISENDTEYKMVSSNLKMRPIQKNFWTLKI